MSDAICYTSIIRSCRRGLDRSKSRSPGLFGVNGRLVNPLSAERRVRDQIVICADRRG
jgi:hypothetical protein